MRIKSETNLFFMMYLSKNQNSTPMCTKQELNNPIGESSTFSESWTLEIQILKLAVCGSWKTVDWDVKNQIKENEQNINNSKFKWSVHFI